MFSIPFQSISSHHVLLYNTLSLHIRGANEIGKRDLVGSWANKFKINVGAFQETKVNSNQRMESKNITGFLAPVSPDHRAKVIKKNQTSESISLTDKLLAQEFHGVGIMVHKLFMPALQNVVAISVNN